MYWNYTFILTIVHSLVSRDGYVVVDDTHRAQFDQSPWPWVVNKSFPAIESGCSAVPVNEVNIHNIIIPWPACVVAVLIVMSCQYLVMLIIVRYLLYEW